MSTFALLMLTIYSYSRLNASPYIESAEINNGEYKVTQEPNPKYPSEQEIKVHQTLLNINPAGQALQISEKNNDLEILPIYSLGIIIIITTLGLIVFEQKDLK